MYNYVVNNMYKSEELVSENKHHGDNNGKPVIVDGNSKIMISTPHCVKHIRDGKIKSSDVFTYSLGDFLNKSLDCPFINQSGLDGGRPKIYNEIAKELECTRERARQIEMKALRKLRQRSFYDIDGQRKLKDYL